MKERKIYGIGAAIIILSTIFIPIADSTSIYAIKDEKYNNDIGATSSDCDLEIEIVGFYSKMLLLKGRRGKSESSGIVDYELKYKIINKNHLHFEGLVNIIMKTYALELNVTCGMWNWTISVNIKSGDHIYLNKLFNDIITSPFYDVDQEHALAGKYFSLEIELVGFYDIDESNNIDEGIVNFWNAYDEEFGELSYTEYVMSFPHWYKKVYREGVDDYYYLDFFGINGGMPQPLKCDRMGYVGELSLFLIKIGVDLGEIGKVTVEFLKEARESLRSIADWLIDFLIWGYNALHLNLFGGFFKLLIRLIVEICPAIQDITKIAIDHFPEFLEACTNLNDTINALRSWAANEPWNNTITVGGLYSGLNPWETVYLTCRQLENQPGNAGHDGIFHYTVYVTSEPLPEFPHEIKLGPKNCQVHLKPNNHGKRKSLLIRSFAFANATISWRFWTSRTVSMKPRFILNRFVYHLENTPIFNIIKNIFDRTRQRTSPVIKRDFDLDALIQGVRDEQAQYDQYDIEYKEYYPCAPRDAGIAYFGSDQVVIGFKTWVNVEEKDEVDGFPIVDKIVELNTVIVEIYGIEPEDFIDMVLLREDVEYAELNFVYQTCYTPNDPLWDQQWGPKVINCPEAWDIEKGAHIANIAVIDTGCNRFHEDIWNKPSFDYDFVNNDDEPIDDNGHGTHCTGIATGIIDNEKGIAGVAQVGSLHIKVLDAGGAGYISDIAKGIVYVTNPSFGVKVISMSLGGYGLSVLLHLACDYARYIKGKFLVAAAGNEGVSHLCFPARYRSVVSVGAVDKNLQLCQWSNHGPNLDLVAPGESIISTIGDNQYTTLSGTSMATPHVAGVAALYFSRNYNHPPVLCEGQLFSTAMHLGTGYGHGLVNAHGVVQRSKSNNMPRFFILPKILQHFLAIIPLLSHNLNKANIF